MCCRCDPGEWRKREVDNLYHFKHRWRSHANADCLAVSIFEYVYSGSSNGRSTEVSVLLLLHLNMTNSHKSVRNILPVWERLQAWGGWNHTAALSQLNRCKNSSISSCVCSMLPSSKNILNSKPGNSPFCLIPDLTIIKDLCSNARDRIRLSVG